MIAKRLLQTPLLKSFLNSVPKVKFAQGKWKEREESAEKAFINVSQKKTLSKLLHRLQEQQENFEAKQSQFEKQLKQIVDKYEIKNSTAFVAEVINLHKSM